MVLGSTVGSDYYASPQLVVSNSWAYSAVPVLRLHRVRCPGTICGKASYTGFDPSLTTYLPSPTYTTYIKPEHEIT